MKKFALILAGCGQQDGSETHEVILTLLALAQEGVQWDAFAPDVKQNRVINHFNNAVMPNESRSVLIESARLVRGNIKPLIEAKAEDYDAIIIPGGVGSMNILCDWFDQQANYQFEPSVKCFLDDAIALRKPLGFICIAPMMIPKLVPGASLTIGCDASLNEQLHALGAEPINCLATDVVVDAQNLLVSTPANMVANSIDEVAQGIRKCVQALLSLSAQHVS